eukprot:2855364-Rhodomonas_salina.4
MFGTEPRSFWNLATQCLVLGCGTEKTQLLVLSCAVSGTEMSGTELSRGWYEAATRSAVLRGGGGAVGRGREAGRLHHQAQGALPTPLRTPPTHTALPAYAHLPYLPTHTCPRTLPTHTP